MKKFITMLLVSLMIITGCVKLARYDAQTYKSVTYTKVDVLALYESRDSLDSLEWQIRSYNIGQQLDRMIEYESHKKNNVDVTKQMKLLKKIYNEHLADISWDTFEKELYKEIIKASFDAIIESETAKNKELF